MVTTLFQHCNAVLCWKSSLRIAPCNISLYTDDPLALAVNKSPAVFVVYHAHSRDFEEKLEGLWLRQEPINRFLTQASVTSSLIDMGLCSRALCARRAPLSVWKWGLSRVRVIWNSSERTWREFLMVKNVEVKTQGIIPRNEVQISRPGKKFLRKEQPRGTGESCRSQASHHYELWLSKSEAKNRNILQGKITTSGFQESVSWIMR